MSELFGAVCITRAIAEEVNCSFSAFKPWNKCIEDGKIIIVPISNTILAKQMIPLLHKGEAETICLALEKKANLCLMEDKEGRLVAQSNNLPITGTFGILIESKQSGLVSAVKPLIGKLRTRHHFWISEEMYYKILNMAEETLATDAKI